MDVLINFIVENFWLIMIVLIMLTYNKRLAVMLSTLFWILSKPSVSTVITALLGCCILLSYVVMTDSSYKKDYNEPNDPDYE